MNFLPILLLFEISFVFSANFHEQDLFTAAGYGDIEDFRYLVEVVGVPANIRNGVALIEAASHGNLEVVCYLVEEGPENTRIPANIGRGWALIYAAGKGRLNIVGYLLESYSSDFNGDQFERAINACKSSKVID